MAVIQKKTAHLIADEAADTGADNQEFSVLDVF